jgi:hypothetical protein
MFLTYIFNMNEEIIIHAHKSFATYLDFCWHVPLHEFLFANKGQHAIET